MKKIKIFIIVFIVIAILGIMFFVIDYNRVQNKKLPIFCIEIGAYLDGGTHEYLGLLYKVIDFHVLTEDLGLNNEKITNSKKYEDIKIGTWFMKYSDFEDEFEK